MSIQPVCDFCHKELEDFGGLIFSPPKTGHGDGQTLEQDVQKLHVCKTCYNGMVSMFMKKNLESGQGLEQGGGQDGGRTLSAEQEMMQKVGMLKEIKPGVYKHSKKGTLYRVIGVAKQSETLEDLVIYESLYENEVSKLWARPAGMFLEHVEVNGSIVPRFVFVSDTL